MKCPMNNGSVKDAKNNISLMMNNLYYRMKLLADFIKGERAELIHSSGDNASIAGV